MSHITLYISHSAYISHTLFTNYTSTLVVYPTQLGYVGGGYPRIWPGTIQVSRSRLMPSFNWDMYKLSSHTAYQGTLKIRKIPYILSVSLPHIIIIIIIEGLSLLQSIPPTTADKQTQAQKRRGSRSRKLLGATPYMHAYIKKDLPQWLPKADDGPPPWPRWPLHG